MRKIEKPTIKHKTIEQVVKPVADSPYGLLDEVFPDAKGKLKYAWEHEVADEDNFKPHSQFYVATADGGRMYFKTNSRARAQELADTVFGRKYIIRVEIKAQVR